MGFDKIRRIKEWKAEQRHFINSRYEMRGSDPSFSIKDKEVNIERLADRSVDFDLNNSRGNSYGRNLMIKKMNNRTLIDYIYLCLENVGIRSDQDITYDEALANILVPELLERLEDIDRQNNPELYKDNPKVVYPNKENLIPSDMFGE